MQVITVDFSKLSILHHETESKKVESILPAGKERVNRFYISWLLFYIPTLRGFTPAAIKKFNAFQKLVES